MQRTTGETTLTQVRATVRCKTLLLLVFGIIATREFVRTRKETVEADRIGGLGLLSTMASLPPFIAAMVLFP
jgi:hypothetical protein